MSAFATRYGPWALVTGASSGVGAEMARQLAARGCNVVLLARRRQQLEAVAAEVEAVGVRARVLPADLGQSGFVESVCSATADLEIGLLVNNAGYAITGPFLDVAVNRHRELLAVNCLAPLSLVHAFVPAMLDRERGGVINVCSMVASTPMPQWATYAASKAFLLSLSEALWFEVRDQGVDVLAVCPGPTDTAFGEVAGVKNGDMPPALVVSQSLAALGRRPSLVTGGRNRLRAFLLGTLPRQKRIAMGARIVRDLQLQAAHTANQEAPR